jgi:hypothetical protein
MSAAPTWNRAHKHEGAGTMSPRVQSEIGVALLLMIFAIVTWRALIS